MEVTQQYMTSTTNNSDGLIGKLTLYVGDLDANVNENQLFDVFSQVAPIASIKLCRDLIQHSSLSYAYVNFFNSQDGLFFLSPLLFRKKYFFYLIFHLFFLFVHFKFFHFIREKFKFNF